MRLPRRYGDADSSCTASMGFISFVMGAFLVTQAFGVAGFGGAALMLLLWVTFGHFLGAPPCIGVLASYNLWKEDEAIGTLMVQGSLFAGLLWLLGEVFTQDITLWFCMASGVNGLLMAPAMVKEKQDQINSKSE